MTPSLRAPEDQETRVAWAVGGLIGVCILVELALTLADFGILGPPRLRNLAYEYAGFWPGLLGRWQANYATQPYLMFVTYAFLHGGFVHLLVNMMTLYSLGNFVGQRVGVRRLAVVYISAVLGGALCFGLLAPNLNPMVGASGGLFGLIGALLAWNYVDLFAANRALWPILRAVLFLILLNVVLWWAMGGHLAWQTHLGGFIAGWIAALLVAPLPASD
jgi:membrane associated rhomboid family serine protease